MIDVLMLVSVIRDFHNLAREDSSQLGCAKNKVCVCGSNVIQF